VRAVEIDALDHPIVGGSPPHDRPADMSCQRRGAIRARTGIHVIRANDIDFKMLASSTLAVTLVLQHQTI
jgi:hypothetical protein